ncbi:MAG TPA: alpha/beta hydrolase [Dehalococcoidia bacterium]|nr:alpha/beta hydrolase [Dehalococcoidia bacterium]
MPVAQTVISLKVARTNMPFASVNGTDIYYETHGSGPAVVFAHGSGGNHLAWWQQMPFFSKHYMCIIFDHRSFGLTKDESEPKGRAAFADDLKGLLDHLGVERTAIVAHSMGGRAGVGFTLRNPGRVWGLVLSGSNGGSVNDEARLVRDGHQNRKPDRPPGALRALSLGFAASKPEMAFLYRQFMRLNPKHDPDFLTVPLGYQGSTHERLTESGVPILYIVGEEDALIAPKTIEIAASLVPQSRLITMPEAGHSVYYEQPDVFNDHVHRFLTEVMPLATDG